MKPLEFHRVCDASGEFYPWVKTLCGKSGAYVVRSNWLFKAILYVGESHSGNLSKTLKRHFFNWRDDPIRRHHVYDRHRIEVAVRVTPAKHAVATQNGLIQRLKPRDNGYAKEEDPF